MSELFFSTMERLSPLLRRGDVEACEREAARELQKLPRSPFHVALDVSITNDPLDAAQHFDRFFDLESRRFPVGAAYTEMNGFDINPNCWYCDLFAYRRDGGQDEHDWISDWQSEHFDGYRINGLERLQEVYASEAFRAKENRSASYMSSLMVVIKFQRFMQRAAAEMTLLHFPLYVTAHDFDFIAMFDPRPIAERIPIRKLSNEELMDELIAKLEDEDAKVRFRAVTRFWMIGHDAKRAVPFLIRRLDDPESATRQAAVTALASVDPMSDAVISALIAKYEKDPSPYFKEEVLRAFGKSLTEKAREVLVKALSDGDVKLRRNAAISLKLLGANAKAAASAIEKLLETETDPDIRAQATVALERMRHG